MCSVSMHECVGGWMCSVPMHDECVRDWMCSVPYALFIVDSFPSPAVISRQSRQGIPVQQSVSLVCTEVCTLS